MFSFRGDKDCKINKKEDFIFQAIEWIGLDFVDEDEEDEDEEEPQKKDGNYLLKIYGTTAKCESVCLYVKNFNPYFYVEVWDTFKKDDVKYLKNKIVEKLKKIKKM